MSFALPATTTTTTITDLTSAMEQESRNNNETEQLEKEEEGPLPTLNDVLLTQFSRWYPIFSNLPPNECRRTNVTIKSVLVDLPDSFRDYLSVDGVRLPVGSRVSSGMLDDENDTHDDGVWSDDETDDDEEEEIENRRQTADDDEALVVAEEQTFSFPELNESIQQAIDALGGKVVPKLNWSCPKDAVWINGGSLQCETPGDVYLLLKSSDFCSYDLHHALNDIDRTNEARQQNSNEASSSSSSSSSSSQVKLQLALRKWCNLYPSQEFRCFVQNHELIAISQRQSSQHYPHVVREADMYKTLLMDFFQIVVREHCDANLANYVFDTYIDKKNRVWLVDLNVWGRRTDALLFTWAELMSMNASALPNGPEMRVVETERQVRADPLASYRAPIDTVHIASMTGGDSKKFEEFMKLCEPQSVLDAEEVERQRRELDELS